MRPPGHWPEKTGHRSPWRSRRSDNDPDGQQCGAGVKCQRHRKPRGLGLLLDADKYLSGEPANWGQGDFNGDGRFDQLDVVAALQAASYGGEEVLLDSLFGEFGSG